MRDVAAAHRDAQMALKVLMEDAEGIQKTMETSTAAFGQSAEVNDRESSEIDEKMLAHLISEL